jgi:agmatinase
MPNMKTTVVFFPFDLFGSAGTAVGVHLLAEAVREMIADNRREKVLTRARAYNDRLRLKEFTFEKLPDYGDWRRQGRQAVRQAFRGNDFLLWVSGNHLGTLPIYDELSRQAESTLVIQLDAHLDVHHFRDCTAELSHGNFLLHCDGPLPPIVNVGHRDLLLTPEYTARSFRRTFSAAEVTADFDTVSAYLRTEAATAGRVFVDVDCDVFDPTFFPAVTQPVPFGLTPQQVLRVIDAVWSPNVAGLFLSEFEPGRDRQDQCLATLVWLIEYVLLRRYES